MSPFAMQLQKTRSETMTVDLEPALNAFISALLVAKDDNDPGIHDWVRRAQSGMTKEERGRHKLVMIGMHYAVAPLQAWPSFPAYLAHLEQQPPSVFRENLLESYAHIHDDHCTPDQLVEVVKWDKVLSSATSYVAFLKTRFAEDNLDVDLETRAYQYVLDTAAMKQLILDHLRWFWTNYLEDEWRRVQPLLEESVKSFQNVRIDAMSRLDTARFVTGQDLEEMKWQQDLEQ